MRKLSIGLAVLALLALSLIPVSAGLSSAPSQQVTTSDLLTFADSVPYAAPLYVSLRLDSGYIETLDGLIGEITDALPPNILPPNTNISTLLDVVSQTVTGASFAEGLRPLVGNMGAIAVGSLDGTLDYDYNNDTPPVALYLSITDRSTTTALLESILNDQLGPGEIERSDTAGATTLYIEFLEAALVITDDTLIATTSFDMIAAPDAPSLAEYTPFIETIGALPAESYNGLMYVDVAYLGSAALGSSRYMRFQDRAAQAMLARSLGTWAVGIATLDGRTLAADLAVRPGNLAGLEAIGLDIAGGAVPVNPALLARVPADSALVWHGSNVGGVVDFARRNLHSLADTFTGGLLDQATVDSLLESSLAIPNMFLTNFSGLTSDELGGWLSGDYLIVVQPNMNYFAFDASMGLPFDFGIILEATDAAASREAMTTLARDLPLMMRSLGSGYNSLTFSESRIGDADAVIVSVASYAFARGDYVYTDFALAADDGVFVFGGRGFVESVLANAENTTSPFENAQPTLLSDSTLNLYVNPVPLMGLVTTSTFYSPDFNRLRFQVPQALLTLLESATGSMTFDEAGNTIVRFTITLAEDREDNVAAASATYEAFAAMATARSADRATEFAPTQVPFFTPTPTPFIPTIPPTPTAALSADGGFIEDGQTVSGSLAASERDLYLYLGEANSVINITMESADFDTYLEILDPGGQLVASNDDRASGDLNSEIIFSVPFDAPYQIIARAYSGSASGDYTLSIVALEATEEAPIVATPTPTPTFFAATEEPTEEATAEATEEAAFSIEAGDTIEGSLPTGGQLEYVLNVTAGDSYTIDLSSPDFDTVVEIYDEDGAQVAFNDDFSGTNSRISNFSPTSAGEYTVLVRSFANVGGGDYVLAVTRGSAPAPTAIPTAVPSASDLTYGMEVENDLPLGERQNYTFTGSAGDVVTIEMEAAFDTYLRLLDSSGVELTFNDDRGDGTYNSQITRFILPENGEYTIVAGSYNDNGTGDYTLTLTEN